MFEPDPDRMIMLGIMSAALSLAALILTGVIQ